MRLKSFLFLTLLLNFFFFQTNFAQDKKLNPALYRLDSILKVNSELTKQIILSDVEMLMVNDCKLNEVESSLEMLKYENIASKIDFKKQQEIAIYEYYTEITTQTAQLRVIINQYISNLDFWYYKKALENLAGNDTIQAIDKLEKSLLINPFYIPSLYQKAMLYLRNLQTNMASNLAQFIALNIYPEGNDQMLLKAMNEQIYKQFKNRGDKMLTDDFCNEALAIFMQADTFCKYFTTNDCEYFKNGIIQSKYGLYRSYLRVADQAIDAHKYSIAETFVMKAKEFAANNKTAIINDETADNFLKRIINKYIDLGIYYKRNADFTKSSYYIEKANTICSIVNDKDCEALFVKKETEANALESFDQSEIKTIQSETKYIAKKDYGNTKNIKKRKKRIKKFSPSKKSENESAIQSIKQHKKTKSRDYNLYCTWIEMGNILTDELKYDEAFEKYKAAKEIENKVLPKPNPILDSIIKATGYHSINAQLQSADFLIWANELNLADTAYSFAISLQQKYHLEKDSSTFILLDLFRNKIKQKACQNIQDEIDLMNSKCNNYIAFKDFEKAGRSIEDTKKLISKYPECILNKAKTDDLSKRLQPIDNYYRLKEKAKKAFENKDYKTFTENYYQADQVYQQSKLDSIGIANITIIDFLNYQSNEEVLLYAANYFIEFYNFDNALSLLKLIKNKAYQANKVKDIQIRLAQKQSKIDKLRQPVFDATKNIILYTAGDKWFKVFITEYRKN